MSNMAARAPEPATDYAEKVLDEIRQKIQVGQRVIDEARERRNLVKDIVEAYHGVLRTYDAGSIAHGTAKNPLPDADCGGVLDRRSYQRLDGALALQLVQVLGQRPRVHPDAQWNPSRACLLDHLAGLLEAADVARVDAHAVRPRVDRLERERVVEVDVGDHRDR